MAAKKTIKQNFRKKFTVNFKNEDNVSVRKILEKYEKNNVFAP